MMLLPFWELVIALDKINNVLHNCPELPSAKTFPRKHSPLEENVGLSIYHHILPYMYIQTI